MTPRLLHATTEVLKAHRPGGPLFSNMIAAELFDAAYTRGPFKVLPRTDGRFVAVDTRAPLGKAQRGQPGTLEQAFAVVLGLDLDQRAKARPEAA